MDGPAAPSAHPRPPRGRRRPVGGHLARPRSRPASPAARSPCARRPAAHPAVAAAVDDGSLPVAVTARVAAALVKVRPHLDRPDALIDGQPAEATLHAVVVDGVLSLLCQARGGLSDEDPLLPVEALHQAPARSRRSPRPAPACPAAWSAAGGATAASPASCSVWAAGSCDQPHRTHPRTSERRATRIETGGRCQGAGCRTGPGRRLVPHDADPWHRSRTTSLRDTVLRCEQTHHQLHSGGTIRLTDGRRLGPDGWITGAAA